MTERAGPPRLPSAFSRGGDLQAEKRSTRSPPFPILRKKSPPSTPELFQHAPSRTTTKVPQRRHQDLRNKEAISTLFIGDEDEIELMTYLEANPLTSEDLAFLLPAGTTTQSPPHGLAFSTYTEYVSVSPSPGGQPSSSIEFRREDEPSGLIDVEYKSDSTQGRFDLVLAPGFTNHGEPLDDSVSSAGQGITCGGTHSSGNSTSSSKNSSSILSSSDRGRGRSSVKVSNKKTSFSRSAADRNKNKDKTGPAKPRGPKVSATKKKSPITPHANCRFVSSPFEVVKGFGQDDENDATDEEIGWNGPFGHQTSSTESKKGSSPWTSSSSLLPARRCCFSFKDWGERLGSPGFAGPPPTSNVKPIKRTAKSASTTKATILSRSPSRATIKPSLKNTREARAPALSETRPMPLTMEANHSEASALAVSLPCAKPESLPNLVLDIPHHPFTLGPVSFGSYDGATTHEERDEEEAEYLNKEGETLSDSALDILMHAFSSDGLSDCPFMGEVPVIAHEIQERGASFFEASAGTSRNGCREHVPGSRA